MANLTIKVDEDLLRRARIKALHEGTSVNRLLAGFLEQFAGEDPRAAGWRTFLTGARATKAESKNGRDWARDELYHR